MPADEFAGLIGRAGGLGQNRLMRQMAADIGGQLRRRSVAAGLILLQRLVDDRLQVVAVLLIYAIQRRRFLFANDPRGLHGASWKLIRPPAGQQLKKDYAERINVAPRID